MGRRKCARPCVSESYPNQVGCDDEGLPVKMIAQAEAAMSDEDDIILSELDDDELVQQMHDDLYDGLQD